ncbi:Neuronal acetylcholine receptor subunit alpha-10 [Orchesella cincta]|uniref:Neuronal acetylcholine receptor subunit alpha-10 n=1 Tax=Orchesella cincta TaxID=48709 RepID=A0A1D2MM40_ORCCI|nr:Neuronal acetylcholine receptor subunit alpha-10 [Orchesella cincta]
MLMWIDESFKWNSTDYGGIKQVRIPVEKVWKPDIILYNNADSQYNQAILSTNIIVNADGNLTWLSTAIFKSSCQINVEYFPFDEQNCTMKFASWTYDGYQLNLVIQTEDGDLSNYVTNGEWSLIAMRVKRNVITYSCCEEPYPDITYSIVLRRRPLFYVFNLILPCVLISGLALLSFYMPSDSGEKVTLGITTLLSMTVFLMVIGESMPPTSEKLPLIGLYYGVTISLVSFATGLSVVTLNIHHRGMRGRRLPPFMRRLIFDYLAKFLLLKLEMPKRAYLFRSSDDKCLASGSDGEQCSTDCNNASAFNSTAKASVLRRRVPVGDTWRLVHPDLPSTPPTASYCHCKAHQSLNSASWREKARNNPTNCDPRFRPVVHVRGVQAGDLPIPLATLSGGLNSGLSGARSFPQARSIHHPCQQYAFDDTFIDFKSRRAAYEMDDLLLEDTVGARLSGTGGGSPGGTGNNGSSNGIAPWQRRLLYLLYRINETLEKNEDRMDDQERKDLLKLEWQQAALVIDSFGGEFLLKFAFSLSHCPHYRLLLWIFVIATIAATFGILYMSPHTKLFTT